MSNDHRGIGMTSQRSRDRLIRRLSEMGIQSAVVLKAIRDTPRHLFVDEALASRAYENNALPIGHGQTISQPYIVARMTEALLNGGPLGNVLEIGTGCGYQTVVLAQLVGEVYSVERIEALARKARERARMLHYRNIRINHGDGSQGWPKHAPYDGIVVTAAPLGVPRALLDQLGPNGRLVIPVGLPGEQELLLISRAESGVHEERLDWVSFVPMLEGVG
ncbi:MAG: protein-L-isoaspartate(D-aspartate) O-methyltransferase [Gammaproteobacteria bacterium]|nr:protein-L-isoaspartate(D-aspartate) O-methyltransferase [Gammaproteobacteria bacterium]MCI0591036.1 protein-L-isoaspartate(D-aspartate) O-methyltransferase [Gammaproteobacteria bacterium]